jgi:CheY-like chemotaxis protein
MRQLLAFSRKQVIVPTPLNVNEVVIGMLGMLNRLIGAEVSLQTDLQPGPVWVTADHGQLQQVVMNLVVNARDALPRGGTITIRTSRASLAEEGRVGQPGLPAGEYVLLGVTDTGYGMDAITRGRIFEPFFTTKELGRGTGLGLATVYGIVKQANGHIVVESELGQGSTFKIYLPISDEARQASQAVAEHEPPRGTETILLVDDDEGVRRMTRDLLRGLGYRVLEAADGHEALLRCEIETGPIDLLLTDAIMPELGGRALASKVTDTRPGVRVLFMSGYAEDDVVHREAERGNFIHKPFSAAALTKKVREVLGSFKLTSLPGAEKFWRS